MSVLSGKADYNKGILDELNQKANTIVVKARDKAKELGNEKVMNIILLGSIVKLMELEDINWNTIIEENVKEQFIDINKKALEVGMELV